MSTVPSSTPLTIPRTCLHQLSHGAEGWRGCPSTSRASRGLTRSKGCRSMSSGACVGMSSAVADCWCECKQLTCACLGGTGAAAVCKENSPGLYPTVRRFSFEYSDCYRPVSVSTGHREAFVATGDMLSQLIPRSGAGESPLEYRAGNLRKFTLPGVGCAGITFCSWEQVHFTGTKNSYMKGGSART